MSDKMTLLFVKETGHVVAGLTRAADPEANLTADVLAGEALSVRLNPDTEFLVEPDQLDVLITDFDEGVLAAPRMFFVDQDKKVQPVDVTTTVSASFSGTAQLTVTTSVTEERKVWVEIVGPTPNSRQIVTDKLAAATGDVTINLRPLVAGTAYDILVLIGEIELSTFTDTA